MIFKNRTLFEIAEEFDKKLEENLSILKTQLKCEHSGEQSTTTTKICTNCVSKSMPLFSDVFRASILIIHNDLEHMINAMDMFIYFFEYAEKINKESKDLDYFKIQKEAMKTYKNILVSNEYLNIGKFTFTLEE